jgi:WD40 repeat protein
VAAIALAADSDALFAVTTKDRLISWKPGDREWTELRAAGKDKTEALRHRILASGGGVLATATGRNTIHLWDTKKGKELQSITVPELWTIAVSGDGRLLATCSGKLEINAKYLVEIREIEGGKLVSSWETTFATPRLALSPDHTRIAYQPGNAPKIDIREVKTGKLLRTLTIPGDEPRDYQFLPDGSALVTMGYSGVIGVWNPQTGKSLRPVEGHAGHVRGVVFVPGGGWITAGDDWTVRRWDASGKEVGRFEGHTREVTSLALSPDGKTLFTASLDGTARAWDLAKRTELRSNNDAALGSQQITSLSLSPDGKTIATVSGFSLRLIDATAFKSTGVIPGDAKRAVPFRTVNFLEGGRLATRSASLIQVWNQAGGNEVYRLDGRNPRVGGDPWRAALAVSPDGKRFAVPLNATQSGKDKPVYLGVCEAETGKVLDRIELGTNGEVTLTAVAFASDGKLAVAGSREGKLYVIDLEKKAVSHTFNGHRGAVLSIAVSPDGKTVASGSADTTVLVWDLTKP